MLVAFSILACDGGDNPAPTPTVVPTEARTPTAIEEEGLGPPEPQLERIFDHIEVIAEEIGARPAGSRAEREADRYAREQFESWGYQVEVQSFGASDDILRGAAVTVTSPESFEVEAIPFRGVNAAAVSGPLLDAGTGREDEFPADASGAIVLFQRQDVPFAEMARRAADAGAVGAIVANREPGLFQGGFASTPALPFVGIDPGRADELRDLLAAGPVEVTASVEELEEVEARNVIARPDSGPCRTLSVGHFDSVPWANGANDNASGSALVLELARASAAAGLDGNCFALFGAEEAGLVGSMFFVSELDATEREALDAVYNYDVLASEVRPLAIGGDDLLARVEVVAGAQGLEVELSRAIDEIGSDHLSFLDAGIPAVMITTPGFEQIHTAADTFANLEPAPFLEPLAELAFGLLVGAGEGA
ncbi:MAG: M28 family metallopeptidase [Dehalococcoidia bacterium]|nr:M28 family metallopeptidase [Dehalococcoidia bacterium]